MKGDREWGPFVAVLLSDIMHALLYYYAELGGFSPFIHSHSFIHPSIQELCFVQTSRQNTELINLFPRFRSKVS